MAHGSESERLIIGWREWLSLPDLGIVRIKAKIDTGARSSALHAFDVQKFRKRGVEMVHFRVHPVQRDHTSTVVSEAPLVDERTVTNSGGRAEVRPVVRTAIRFFGQAWTIELTLTRRDVMGFRMLLGREALRGRFVVDPGRSYLGGRPPRPVRFVRRAER